MKYFVVICCVLVSVSAKDKKISLEDIERDSLKSSDKPTRTIIQQQKPQGSPTTFGFLPVKTAADYARKQPKVQYVSSQYLPQQYSSPVTQQYQSVPQQYYYQPQVQQQYQQYENVQYVTDNSIAAQQQQYYTPQYVYLQQYTAPSTAVQSVVDPKGGVQYIMYVPAAYVPKAEQTQQYENVVQQQSYVVPDTTYVPTQQPQPQVTPSIKYAPEPQVQIQSRPKAPIYTPKSQPKSLLDSYVPSYLQVQYYKQQQARANAIQQSLKDSSPAIGKIEFAKSSYRPTQQHNSAESVLSYNYQIPSNYKYTNTN